MSISKTAPLHLLPLSPRPRREGAALDGPMSAEGAQQRSGGAASPATVQDGPRWVGPPTRESDGRLYFSAFEAGGQQFNLGARCACWLNGGGRWCRAAGGGSGGAAICTHRRLPLVEHLISCARCRLTAAGDNVLLRPADPELPPFLAKLESMHEERAAGGSGGGGMFVGVRWYYRCCQLCFLAL